MVTAPAEDIDTQRPTDLAHFSSAPSVVVNNGTNVCDGCLCNGLCSMQRQRTAYRQQQCMSRRLGRTLKVIVRYTMRVVTGRRVNLQRFQAAILKYMKMQACFASSWLRVSQVTAGAGARHVRTLVDNEQVYEAVMEIPEDWEVANDFGATSDIIADAMSNAQNDEGVMETLRQDAGSDVVITDAIVVPSESTTDTVASTGAPLAGSGQQNDNEAGSGTGVTIGIIMGVISVCGIGAAVAMFMKRRENAAQFSETTAIAEIDEICTPDADCVQLRDNQPGPKQVEMSSSANQTGAPSKVPKATIVRTFGRI